MFSLTDKREILIAAMKEVLEMADTIRDPEVRRPYVMEATRISLRLVEIQKEIEQS